MEVYKMSVTEIQKSISDKKISAEEVYSSLVSRSKQVNSETNALIHIQEEFEANDKDGLLSGIPIVVKDMFCTQGIKTTAASKMLENFAPPFDATVVKKILESGANVLAKANMDEFAMGSTNENSYFGPVKNAVDLSLVAGGSSGGSAVAVATGMSPLSFGSDTGGSIRLPASFNGVYGFKPTYGRMSRFGMIAYGSSLDQAGCFARNVHDLAVLSEVMSGFDEKDSTSFKDDSFTLKSLESDRTFRIGVPKQLSALSMNKEIGEVFDSAIQKIQSLGHEVVEVDLDSIEKSVSCYYIIAMSEASSNLSRFDGVRFGHRSDFGDTPPGSLEEFYSRTRAEGFGEEVKRRILLGTYSLSSGYYDAYYKKACLVRRKIQNEVFDALKNTDLIITPVNVDYPFKIGEKTKDPIANYQTDLLTTFVNLSGTPGMSCPLADTKSLPLGLQIVAGLKDERTLFEFAHDMESQGVFKSEVQDVL